MGTSHEKLHAFLRGSDCLGNTHVWDSRPAAQPRGGILFDDVITKPDRCRTPLRRTASRKL
jgi:hypothetical protein